MIEAGYGSIINMSSMSSINHSPAISAYASSKAAISHMTRNLAFDYGPVVRINAIGPGAVRTGALATVLPPEIEKRMLAHTPLQRLGEVDDIAGAVLYFASPSPDLTPVEQAWSKLRAVLRLLYGFRFIFWL